MSAGGQRGIDVSGITGMRIKDASDVTNRTKIQLVYQTFASTTGANAFRNKVPNGNDYFLQFTEGIKECRQTNCIGLPYQYNRPMTFRN